ncbi:MAG: DUF1800 family protein [Vicinamibacterales bacterium]
MRPIALAVVLGILMATAGAAAGRFDAALAPAKQPAHVLNRLGFGPRPADLAEIRRIGVDRWIRQQLDPAAIPDSPALTTRLAPLESQKLVTWQIFEQYQPPQPLVRVIQPNINQLLPADQLRRLQTGSPDERRALIDALTPEQRQQVLIVLPPNVLEVLPELRQQQERARQIQNEVRNREMQEMQRKLRPPLSELLTPEQARDVQLGTPDEKLAVLNSLPKEKRTLVFRSIQPQSVPDAFKREALAASNPRQAVVAELVEAKLQRAVYSPRQLEEVLVDFWLNHFNVFSGKNTVGVLLTSYERDAIRPFVLGRFRDMLLATARHPAMLSYLDNFMSRSAPDNAPGFGGGVVFTPGPNQGLNENYGRELLELHTLGVDGGYTQADVINVARAFTGWTIFDPQRYGEFQYNPQMHDRAEKVVLGHRFPRGGGEEEGVKIIELLSAHPSTARFISRKLAQRFVADDPPQALVDRMAATFTKTSGDLRAVMETLLFSREFMSEGAWQAKMKTPLEFVASALRALDANVTDTTALAQQLTDMGQPLYGRVDPAGYPTTADAWSGSAGLLRRMAFANALVAGQIAGLKVDAGAVAAQGVRRALTELTGYEPAAETVTAIQAPSAEPVAPTVVIAAIIASPDFQKR